MRRERKKEGKIGVCGAAAVCLVSVALGSSFAGGFREKDAGKRYAGSEIETWFCRN